MRSYFASVYCKQLELTNDESRQSVSADVSMEVVPSSNLAANAEIKSEHDSTDLPKIDTSSVVLAASPHETFATETNTFEYAYYFTFQGFLVALIFVRKFFTT